MTLKPGDKLTDQYQIESVLGQGDLGPIYLARDPHDADAWLENGRILIRCGRRDEALDCFNQALRLHPWHLEGFYEKGAVLFFLNRYNEATTCFSEVQRLEPRSSAKIMREACLSEGGLVKKLF